jgi:hypothetical protein
MATQTLPFFKTGAALASAAAIAVASPAIAPNLTPTPNALSTAQVELTTISDLMSIPGYEWSNVLFSVDSWGGAISTNQLTGLIIEPYASSCTDSDGAGVCTVSGISGVAYLALDALINGNGAGFANADGILENPDEPYQPDPDEPNYNPYTTPPWSVSAVNYLFEPVFYIQLGNGTIFNIQAVQAGLSASSQYILQATLGTAFPALSPLISALYYGPYLVTIAYTTALNAVADAVVNVPLVGPLASNSILAYLGRLATESGALYIEGLSGVLQYWGNIATGIEPFPTATTATTAASLAPAARAASLVTSVAAATSTAADSATSAVEASAVEASEVEATEVEASEAESSEVEAPKPGTTTAVETSSEESTSADDGSSSENSSTESVSAVTAEETTAATTSVVDSPSDAVAATTADAAPTATGPAEASTKTGKRSARGAAARVATKVASAIGAAKAGVAKAGAAQSANGR